MKMRAAIRRKYCLPNEIKIENLNKPIPKDNEVLVRIKATTVNRTDCANLTAKPFIMRFVLGFSKPKKVILGTDFSGIIEAVGTNVNNFKTGDRVFGFSDTGIETQAEYACISEGDLFQIPNKVNFKTAVASLEGAHYAYTFIKKVKIKPGQAIFINGASGGIGSALLQFVKCYGVKVTVTSDSKNIERIADLGADKIYDYTKEDFTKDHEKYDYFFDAVGKSTFGKCKVLLKDRGVYISSELGPYAQNLFYSLVSLLPVKKKVVFPIPYSTKNSIPYIINRLKAKEFNPVVDKEYDLDEISKAYHYVIEGKKTGNVIINV